MRDFEAPHCAGIGKSRHVALQHGEPWRIALGAVLEKHLQSEADAEIRLAPQRLEYGLPGAAFGEAAHAIRQRPLSGDDDTLGGPNEFRLGGDEHLRRGRDMLQRFGYGAQVAHPVIDYCDAHFFSSLRATPWSRE